MGPSGSTETVAVQCYLQGGVPAFVPFTVTFSASSGAVAGAGLLYAYVHDSLTYQNGRAITGAAPKLHACTLNNQPLAAGPYAPAPPGINFSSAGGVSTLTRAGLAQSLVRFPLVRLKPDTVLVTAMDQGAKVCNLNTVWATGGSAAVVRDVNCYLPGSAMDATQSLVSYDTNS